MDDKRFIINKEELEAAQNFATYYVPSKFKNRKQKRLVIFTSPERTDCFDFFYVPENDTYYCKGCTDVRPCVGVKLLKDPDNPRKKKIKFVDDEEEESTDEEDSDAEEDEEEEIAEVAPSRPQKKNGSSSRRGTKLEVRPNPEDYEVVKVFSNGRNVKRLRIFTSAERNELYEYFYDRTQNLYKCRACCLLRHTLSIRIFDGPHGTEEFHYGGGEHICEPLKIGEVLEKIPEEEAAEEPTVDAGEAKIPSRRSTRVRRNAPIVEAEPVDDAEDVNPLRRSKSARRNKKTPKEEVAEEPDVDIEEVEVPLRRSKRVRRNKVKEEVEEVGPAEDEIPPKKSKGNRRNTAAVEELPDAKNYKFFQVTTCNGTSRRLKIYTSDEKSHFYEFYQRPTSDSYICKGCQRFNHTFSVKLENDANGRTKFRFGVNPHICKAYTSAGGVSDNEGEEEGPVQEQKPVRKSLRTRQSAQALDVSVNEDALNASTTRSRKRLRTEMDDSKSPPKKTYFEKNTVIDAEHYEFVTVPFRGRLSQRMYLYTSAERKEFYEFYYNQTLGYYNCKKCHQYQKNYVVTVKMFQDEKDGTMKFRTGRNEHICEPIKVGENEIKKEEVAEIAHIEVEEKPKRLASFVILPPVIPQKENGDHELFQG